MNVPSGKRQEISHGMNRDWLWGAVLALAVVVVYLPVGHAGFIWDDDTLLTKNPCIIGPLGLKEIWTTSEADVCPFVLTTLWAGHALWGLDPMPYHIANVLLHAGCAILLWQVLRGLRAVRQLRPDPLPDEVVNNILDIPGQKGWIKTDAAMMEAERRRRDEGRKHS